MTLFYYVLSCPQAEAWALTFAKLLIFLVNHKRKGENLWRAEEI